MIVAVAAAARILLVRILDCQMQRAIAAAAKTEYYTTQENN